MQNTNGWIDLVGTELATGQSVIIARGGSKSASFLDKGTISHFTSNGVTVEVEDWNGNQHKINVNYRKHKLYILDKP